MNSSILISIKLLDYIHISVCTTTQVTYTEQYIPKTYPFSKQYNKIIGFNFHFLTSLSRQYNVSHIVIYVVYFVLLIFDTKMNSNTFSFCFDYFFMKVGLYHQKFLNLNGGQNKPNQLSFRGLVQKNETFGLGLVLAKRPQKQFHAHRYCKVFSHYYYKYHIFKSGQIRFFDV